jgi:hypothetical protein
LTAFRIIVRKGITMLLRVAAESPSCASSWVEGDQGRAVNVAERPVPEARQEVGFPVRRVPHDRRRLQRRLHGLLVELVRLLQRELFFLHTALGRVLGLEDDPLLGESDEEHPLFRARAYGCLQLRVPEVTLAVSGTSVDV